MSDRPNKQPTRIYFRDEPGVRQTGRTVPPKFKDTAKRLVWLSINRPTPQRLRDLYPNVIQWSAGGSVVVQFRAWVEFLVFLDSRGVSRLADATEEDLDVFSQDGERLDESLRDGRLQMVTRIWALADSLPKDDRLVRPPWIANGPMPRTSQLGAGSENGVQPIDQAVMSPLITWATVFVHDYSPHIVHAFRQRREIQALASTSREAAALDDLDAYLGALRESGRGLPSAWGGLAVEYVAARVGLNRSQVLRRVREKAPDMTMEPLRLDPLPNGGADSPWNEGILYEEIGGWIAALVTACMIVVAYVSGMRSEEVLHLRRGCCTRDLTADGKTIRFSVSGRQFKGIRDEFGVHEPSGRERDEAWIVLKIVADAIKTIEEVVPGDFLFGHSHSRRGTIRAKSRPLRSAAANDRIQRFVTQVNALSDRLRRPELRIPEEDQRGRKRPEGITLRRFRRTIAWYIENQPGGTIALAQQYGHVKTITAENYGKVGHSGLDRMMDMEQAAAVQRRLEEQLHERNGGGIAVSGKAAMRLGADVDYYEQQYAGRVLSEAQAQSLLKNPRLRYFNSAQRFAGCAFQHATAMCQVNSIPNPKQTPNWDRCVEHCANLFRTDADIKRLQKHNEHLILQADRPSTPEPIAQRYRQQVAANEERIREHFERSINLTEDGAL